MKDVGKNIIKNNFSTIFQWQNGFKIKEFTFSDDLMFERTPYKQTLVQQKFKQKKIKIAARIKKKKSFKKL